ncbi:hypothetical protein FUAX_44520 (plasmid) [Fulvitalea axinellae]|uniref:Uncharacterized protein n=1 Tax=Fulvitalea axinellae TaxID=1182444 RepID=A0AAU9CRL4_9BACT|nr:hypothetical protein FUAX_44520 [Fulvitalea axinellae]
MKKIISTIWLSVLALILSFQAGYSTVTPPDWSVRANDFQYNMTVIVFSNIGGTVIQDADSEVAAFVGGQCRGVTNFVYDPKTKRYLAFLTVYSDSPGESVTFKVYDKASSSVHDIGRGAVFADGGVIGSPDRPYSLSDPALETGATLQNFDFATVRTWVTRESDDTFRILVDKGYGVDALVPVFQASPEARVTIDEVPLVSNTDPLDFSQSVTVTVQSEDEWTTNTYTIHAAERPYYLGSTLESWSIGGHEGIIDENNLVTVHVPPGFNVAEAQPEFVLSIGARAKINSEVLTSGQTVVDLRKDKTLVVESEGVENFTAYTLRVIVDYFEGSDLTAWSVPLQNGQTIFHEDGVVEFHVPPGYDLSSVEPTFSLSEGAVAKLGEEVVESGQTNFDLTKDKSLAVISQSGENVKVYTLRAVVDYYQGDELTAWVVPNQSGTTIFHEDGLVEFHVLPGYDITAVRPNFSLSPGATARVGSEQVFSGQTSLDLSRDRSFAVTSQSGESVRVYTLRIVVDYNQRSELLSWSVSGQNGQTEIHEDGVVEFHVPPGYDVASVRPNFILSSEAVAKIGEQVLVSGQTTVDLRQDKSMTVTSQSGENVSVYTLRLVVDYFQGSELTAWSVPFQNGLTSFREDGVVEFHVPPGYDVSEVLPTFSLSEGAVARIGEDVLVSGQSALDLGRDKSLTVTSQSGENVSVYTLRLVVDYFQGSELTAWSVSSQNGQTSFREDGVVEFHVPPGYDVSEVRPTFSLSEGATARVGEELLVSGQTAIDLSRDKSLTVTSQSGENVSVYTLRLVVDYFQGSELLTWSVPQQVGETIFHEDGVVEFHVPPGYDTEAVIPQFTLSDGAGAKVGEETLASGQTGLDLSRDKSLAVTSQSGENVKVYTLRLVVDHLQGSELIYWGVPDQNGASIFHEDGVVEFHVPSGYTLGSVKPSFTISSGASAKIGEEPLVIGQNIDLSQDRSLVVTSQSGENVTVYTLRAVVDHLQGSELLTWSVPDQAGETLFQQDGLIEFHVAPGYDVANVIPNFTISDGATAKIGGETVVSGQTGIDLSRDKSMAVISQSGTSVTVYTLRLVVDYLQGAELLEWNIPDQNGETVFREDGVVEFHVPPGYDLSSVTPSFTISAEAVARIGEEVLTSGQSSLDLSRDKSLAVTSQSGKNVSVYTLRPVVDYYEGAELTAWSVPNQNGTTVFQQDGVVEFHVPPGYDISAVTPDFSLSAGAEARIGDEVLVSGQTALDLNKDKSMTVISQSGEAVRVYTLRLVVDFETGSELLSWSVPDQNGETVFREDGVVEFHVPPGYATEAVVPAFTLSAGAEAKVGGDALVSGQTVLDLGRDKSLAVTSQDGKSVKVYTLRLVVDYLQGSELTAWSVPNQNEPTVFREDGLVEFHVPPGYDLSAVRPSFSLSDGAEAKVGGQVLASGQSVLDLSSDKSLAVTSQDGKSVNVYTLRSVIDYRTEANLYAWDVTGQVGRTVFREGGVVEFHVKPDFDLANTVPTVAVSDGAKVEIDGRPYRAGDAVDMNEDRVVLVRSEDGKTAKVYKIKAFVDYYSGAELTAWKIGGQNGETIFHEDGTVEFHVPPGYDLTSVIPDFEISEGAVAKIGSEKIESGVTSVDLSRDQSLVVTSQSGENFKVYTLRVVIDFKQDASLLTAKAKGQKGETVFRENGVVEFHFFNGKDLSAVELEFSVSPGASVRIDGKVYDGGAIDLRQDKSAVVIAENGENFNVYTLRGIIDYRTGAELLSWTVDGQIGQTEFKDGNVVEIRVPSDFDITKVKARFTLSPGAMAKVGGQEIVSNQTSLDLSRDKSLVVVAESGELFRVYTLRVVVEFEEGAKLLSWNAPGQTGETLFRENGLVEFHVPSGYDISAVKGTFTLSDGAVARVGNREVKSGESALDFTTDISLVVVSESGAVFNSYTLRVVVDFSHSAELKTWEVQGQKGETLFRENGLVEFHVPSGYDLSAVNAEFTLSEGASATLDGEPFVSGQNLIDLRETRTVVVRSESGTEQSVYTLKAIEDFGADARLLAWHVPGQVGGTVFTEHHEVIFHLPYNFDVTESVGVFSLSPGAEAYVGDELVTSGLTALDLSKDQSLRVLAEDGISSNVYTIRAIVDKNDEARIKVFDVEGQIGESVILDQEITVNVPADFDLGQALVTFEVSERASLVYKGSQAVSGITTIDLTKDQSLLVISESGKKQNVYTVRAVKSLSDESAFISFNIAGQREVPVISKNTVTVEVDEGTDLTKTKVNFTVSEGASVYHNDREIVSGKTVIDLSEGGEFLVVSESGAEFTQYNVVVLWIDTVMERFEAANMVTPNGDGFNETWMIKNVEKYRDCKLSIFDLGGRLLYETIGYQNDWGATEDGKRLPVGTYYFKLEHDTEDFDKTGYIQVLY